MFNIFKKKKVKREDVVNQFLKTDTQFKQNYEDNLIGDKQIERINNARQLVKDKKYDEAVVIFEDVLINEGAKYNAYNHKMLLADLYYKMGDYDKAWGYSNKLFLEESNSVNKIREFQVKVLKKEKRFKDALALQLSALAYEGVMYGRPTQEQIEKKLNVLLKKNDLVERSNEVFKILDDTYKSGKFDERLVRDSFKEIISE